MDRNKLFSKFLDQYFDLILYPIVSLARGGTVDPSSVVAPSQVVTNSDNGNDSKPPNRDLDVIE